MLATQLCNQGQKPEFYHLQNEDNSTNLLGGVNETMQVKSLALCLVCAQELVTLTLAFLH